MKDLRQLQEDFADYLKGNRNSPIQADIVTDEKADAAERMGFYHDAYRLRLIEVLSKDYPVLAKLLGEQAFAEMALAYIRNFPSKYRSVRWFGIHLPEFLRLNDKDKHNGAALLEVALFEKARNDVFDCQQSDVVALEQLAAIDPSKWENMRVTLIPAFAMLDFHYNVTDVWLQLYTDEETNIDAYTPDWKRLEYATSWLIWRGDLDQKWRMLDVDEAWAIHAFQTGHTFGEVCGGLTEWLDEQHVPMRAVSILKTLIVDEVVRTIYADEK